MQTQLVEEGMRFAAAQTNLLDELKSEKLQLQKAEEATAAFVCKICCGAPALEFAVCGNDACKNSQCSACAMKSAKKEGQHGACPFCTTPYAFPISPQLVRCYKTYVKGVASGI